MLVVHLGNITILGKKLHANLPRYKRGVVRKNSGSPTIIEEEIRAGFSGVQQRDKVFAWRGKKTYVAVVGEVGPKSQEFVFTSGNFIFRTSEEQQSRMQKAYVGKTMIPGAAYNIHIHMEMEGIFAVKVSPLGGNLCLLEKLEEGYIEDLMGKKENWWNSWFSEVKKWEMGCVDEFRDV